MKRAELTRGVTALLTLACVALQGCAPASRPAAAPVTSCPCAAKTRGESPIVAKLESFDSGDPNASAVWISWGGEAVSVHAGMWLKRGDVIATGHGAKAVLTYLEDGAKVLLLGDTKVQVGSLFTWFGSLFVSGRVDTDTQYAAGKVEGTKYHVSVDKDSSAVTFSVIEGKVTVTPVKAEMVDQQVRVTPRMAVWKPFTLERRQRAMLKDRTAPPVLAPIPKAEVETWIDTVETVPGIGKKIAAALSDLPAAPSGVAARASSYAYVPDVTGASLASARESLKRAGLQLDAKNASPAGAGALRVVSQNPLPRAVVARDSAVCVVAADPTQPAAAAAHSCTDHRHDDAAQRAQDRGRAYPSGQGKQNGQP